MTILVLGGSGLIGSQVARDLVRGGHGTVVASRKPPAAADLRRRWFACDIADRDSLEQVFKAARPTHVVHVAAALQFACERDPSLATRVNVAGTTNVLELARDGGVRRVVFGSSVAVYGMSNTAHLHEDAPAAGPVSLYGSAKRFEEALGARFSSLFGLGFVALRYCGVFGRGEPQSPGMALLRKRIEAARTGVVVSIPEASGEERVQLTYVRDASAATLQTLFHPNPRHLVYNVAGPPQNYMSLLGYYRAIKRLFPAAGPVRFSGRTQDLGPLDVSRIADDLGFEPRYSVLGGLHDMYEAHAGC